MDIPRLDGSVPIGQAQPIHIATELDRRGMTEYAHMLRQKFLDIDIHVKVARNTLKSMGVEFIYPDKEEGPQLNPPSNFDGQKLQE